MPQLKNGVDMEAIPASGASSRCTACRFMLKDSSDYHLASPPPLTLTTTRAYATEIALFTPITASRAGPIAVVRFIVHNSQSIL